LDIHKKYKHKLVGKFQNEKKNGDTDYVR